MSTISKQEAVIKIKEFITDKKGQKVGAVLDMDELARVKDLLEDLIDLKHVEDRINEPEENYEAYSSKRKSRP
jgi:hypothetical protein